MLADQVAGESTDSTIGTAISVHPMSIGDVPDILHFLKRFPEICFCEWEDARLLAQVISQSPMSGFVARDGQHVIGILVCGAMGARATINHIAVDEHYRRQGIGRLLVAQAVASFQSAGIRRIFLFVLRDQSAALRFWEAAGFHETVGEATLERDV